MKFASYAPASATPLHVIKYSYVSGLGIKS